MRTYPVSGLPCWIEKTGAPMGSLSISKNCGSQQFYRFRSSIQNEQSGLNHVNIYKKKKKKERKKKQDKIKLKI